MKRIVLGLALVGLVVGINACSRCYECTTHATFEITDSTEVRDTLTEELCTASKKEVEEKEANDFTCSAL